MPFALVTLYRSLTRHRLYAILNVGGLALGVAVFLVLFLFVRFETGYDRALPGWDRIHVVRRTIRFPASPEVAIPSRPETLAQLRGEWPDVDGARMLASEVAVQNGTTVARESAARVDPGYFRLFPPRAVAGDPASALAAPDAAVITTRVAATWFGSGSAIGRTLTLRVADRQTPFRIGAVIAEPPANTTYRAAIFLPPAGPEGGPDDATLTTFVRFPSTDAARRRIAQFPAFLRRHPDPAMPGAASDVLRQSLVPLASVHLADPRDRAIVGALGLVGVLALLVAVANYVNLATARAGLRAREVAIRKVVGATRTALIVRFLGEAMLTACVAGLIGLALAELALPFVNAAGGTALAVKYLGADSILPPLALLIVAVAAAAGSYPAFVLSRYRPAAVLASVRAPGGRGAGALLRRATVVVQFAIAVVLMIGTAVLVAQTRHLQSADVGFARAGLIGVPSYGDAALDDARRRAFAAAVARIPGVIATAEAAVAPTGGSFGIGPMHRAGATGPDPMIVRGDVGHGFFTVYGARLLAGRFLDSGRYRSDDADRKAGGVAVVLNRTATALLGFGDPASAIGRTVGTDDEGEATIVGVIDDIRFKSPRDRVEPFAYVERGTLSAPVLAVRHRSGAAEPVLDAMAAAWKRIAPAIPYVALPVDRQLYEAFYRADARRSRLFTIGAALAIVIACIGLYGLAAFDTERRVREIGIRKALGASTGDVLRLMVGGFLKPVLVADVIAVPIGYGVARAWLSGFDDRIALSPWLFAAPVAAAAAIALATVANQSRRVARSEPWAALRHQ